MVPPQHQSRPTSVSETSSRTKTDSKPPVHDHHKALAMKNHMVAMLGEYIGTTSFILFCLGGTHVALLPSNNVTDDTDVVLNNSSLFYIALSFGLSLTVNAWMFFRVSGGLFNPAVSLGMVLAGCLPPVRGALTVVSQILGAITGAAIIDALVPGQLNAGTSLNGGISVVQGLFIEVFLTCLLMLTIFFLAAEKHKATFIAPLGIGMALFISELVGVYYTGGSLNPARSFGPAVVTKTFPTYHWIYWIGPCLGSVLATGIYRLLKWLDYETVLEPEQEAALNEDVDNGSGTNSSGGKENASSPPDNKKVEAAEHPDRDARLDRMESLLRQLVQAQRQPVASSPV